MNTHTTTILRAVEETPWFSRLGQPEAAASGRLSSWGDWAGPEAESVERIHLQQQDLHDRLIANDTSGQLAALFERVRDRVIQLARSRVPYNEASDAWHAPSTAVWHAAWTAGLIAICAEAEIAPPESLASQWQWFRDGHWPAAYASKPTEPPAFVIY